MGAINAVRIAIRAHLNLYTIQAGIAFFKKVIQRHN
jgi:hypothetical protein